MTTQSDRIREGQVYRVTKGWEALEITFQKGDTFGVVKIDKLVRTTYPSRLKKKLQWALDSDDLCRWQIHYFEEMINSGFLEHIPNTYCKVNVALNTTEPANNGSREACYWCHKPTEPMFGTLTICRACGK